MANKRCFIIMPFGGDNDAQRRHSLGVYQSILRPAAEAAGYEAKRADTGQAPGNITADIVQDLASADMVIADLTGGNANVFFELGIRHVLRKSGTVHVVDRSSDIPFDVRQYRVIEYSTHLADIPGVLAEIVEAIRKREDNAARSDNPVHDALVGLPADFRDVSDEERQRQIDSLRETLGRTQRERDELSRRLADLDPVHVGQPYELDIDDMLDHAEDVMKSTGEYVMLRLQEIINSGGRDAFVHELRSVLKSPYLTDNDFMGLAQMCRGLDLTDHRRVILEVANRRYPNEPQVLLALVDAYDDSPEPRFQDRGRLMIEEYLRVERVDGAADPRMLPGLMREAMDNALGLLFNFYFTAGRADWVLSVCESGMSAGYDSAVLGRNLARAFSDLGRMEEAETAFRTNLAKYDDSATFQLFGSFLNNLGRHREAYEQIEAGVISNPTATTYLNLAIEVLNQNLIRSANDEIVIVDRDGALRSAIPIIQAGMTLGGDFADRQRAVHILIRRNALVEAQAIAQGMLLDDGYDASTIKYITRMIALKRSTIALGVPDHG